MYNIYLFKFLKLNLHLQFIKSLFYYYYYHHDHCYFRLERHKVKKNTTK